MRADYHVHGGDIYSDRYELDFSANLNPLGMPAPVRDAALEGVRESARYPDVLCRELRAAIAQRERIPAERILCGNGAADLIFSLVRALRPRKALLATPCFAEYERALQAAGAECLYYPCRREQGFALGEDYLKWLDGVELAFLCNPANPTGLCIDAALLDRICGRCRERGIMLILDECFLELTPEGASRTLAGKLESYPGLIVLKACTKTYAMPGLRLGYAMTCDTELLEEVRSMRQPWNVSIPAQRAGIAAMKEEEFVQESVRYIAAERHFLEQELRRIGLHFYPSAANYIFFEGPADLQERCRREGILIRACANYRGLEQMPAGVSFFRIAVRTHEENERLTKALERVLHAENM